MPNLLTYKLFFVFALVQFNLQKDIDLLNLKSHWTGQGVSFLYPKHMKLLSDKLKNQAGFVTTYNSFPSGDTWDLKAKLVLKCNNFNDISPTENDFGLGVFLTKNNPKRSMFDYKYDYASELFGMSHDIEGLSMMFNKNNLYVGLFKSENSNRDDLFSKSKICKAYLQKSGNLMLSVKYRSKVIGVYIGEEKEKFEHLCYQFTDIADFDQFYLTISGSDRNSGCSADVSDLVITTNFEDYQFVENEQKKADEYTYTYFKDSSNTSKKKEFEHFHTVYDFYRDNAKIFAHSLLKFADYNEKEVVHEMKSSIQKTEKAIDDAISIVELESKQIEALNSLLSSERRSVTSDVNETLDQILKWLSTMDGMFDKVDTETQAIHGMLNNLNFDEKLETLIAKIQKVGDGLAKAIGTTKLITNPSKLDTLDLDQISTWKQDIDNFQSNVNEKLTSKAEKKMNRLAVFFVCVLGIIAVSILIAFIVIYCKIQAAIRRKRTL